MKRENRYLVIKRADIAKYLGPSDVATLYQLSDTIGLSRISDNRLGLECVVVESDWPEYEPTWAAIEARVYAEAPVEVDNKHYCNDGYWWEVTGKPDHAHCVAVGQHNTILESNVFAYRGAAYDQKNKWLTKYGMFCLE